METRKSARAILFNSRKEILLFRFRFEDLKDPVDSDRKAYWITPGGGLEKGESFEAALLRELREETGIQSFSPGR